MAKLLVIDDDENVRQMLKEHLTNKGHEVSTASRAKEGLSKALKTSPDLIILDAMLPDETGFQACGKLRRKLKTQNTPIIMMSETARSESQQHLGRLMGANEYLLKPLNVIEVGDKVHELLTSPLPPPPTMADRTEPAEKPASPHIPSVNLDHLFDVTSDPPDDEHDPS